MRNINKSDFELFYGVDNPEEIKKNDYLDICSSLINKIKEGDFEKVILSRIKKTVIELNPLEIFEKLNRNYSNTFNYIISIENVGCWLGATPEVLLNIEDEICKSVSIAGTKSKNETNWGDKEIEEQQLVTDYIHNILKEQLGNLVTNGPFTITAGEVAHLKTEFTGNLFKKKNWTQLINSLHPTPATCGIPKTKAQRHIESIELHQRKYYTGFLGPISNLKKQLFVNLRCMEVQGNTAFLYLGGGITSKSIAEDEWNETENKAKTLLNAISNSNN